MMRTLNRLSVLILLVLTCWTPGRAEVSVELNESGYGGFIILGRGGGDGGSPWPWLVERDIDPALALNPEGDWNHDGLPSFDIDPKTGYPSVVWAWFDGTDYEIALARWTGESWSTWQILTDNETDDLDPSVTFGDDGKTHVSWWRPGVFDQVWYIEGDANRARWSNETRVTGGFDGARPDTAWSQIGPVVAFQSNLGNFGMRQVFVARGGDPWLQEPVAMTPYNGPADDGNIDVKIHAQDDLLWVDWVNSDGQLAWSQFDPETEMWSMIAFEEYTWDEEGGEFFAREFARGRIRLALKDNARREKAGR